MAQENIKLAIQKKGRLFEKSWELLKLCGLDIDNYSQRLLISARNFELDALMLRDDDIPEYVQDGVADIGIVGEDVLYEKEADVEVIKKLGFSRCKLMIGIPESEQIESIEELNGKRIATSHTKILEEYLQKNNIDAKIVEISGSVEIAPSLGVADFICDIVSTGTTLKLNKLKKSFTVFESEAVLIANKKILNNTHKKNLVDDLLARFDSVMAAKKSKYLMMNIPKDNLDQIIGIIPSLKSPTVLTLAEKDMLAVHAVIPSDKFWSIVNDLKKAGATGILLLPIENMIR